MGAGTLRVWGGGTSTVYADLFGVLLFVLLLIWALGRGRGPNRSTRSVRTSKDDRP